MGGRGWPLRTSLGCAGSGFLQGEVGPVHGHLLPRLLGRVQAKPDRERTAPVRSQPLGTPSPSVTPAPVSSQPLRASSPTGRAQPAVAPPSPLEILHFSVSLVHLCPVQVLGQEHIIWGSRAQGERCRAGKGGCQLGKGPP